MEGTSEGASGGPDVDRSQRSRCELDVDDPRHPIQIFEVQTSRLTQSDRRRRHTVDMKDVAVDLTVDLLQPRSAGRDIDDL